MDVSNHNYYNDNIAYLEPGDYKICGDKCAYSIAKSSSCLKNSISFGDFVYKLV